MATIGIGIPFYNAEKYLDFAIRSVINQSFTDWVLYLVDDGSTDGSLRIAQKYIGDKRIKVFSDAKNRGLVYRLNQITSLLNTKYLVRMDADDIMHPERLKVQLSFLEKNAKVDVVGSWAYSIDIDNRIHGLLKNSITPSTLNEVIRHMCFIHPSVMGKRSWFVKNPYSDLYPRLEDMELWCRTIDFSSFMNIPQPLLFYREVGMPYLSKYLKSMKGERLLIAKKVHTANKILLVFRNYMKCVAYTLFSVLCIQDVLIKKRSFNIVENELKSAVEILLSAIK